MDEDKKGIFEAITSGVGRTKDFFANIFDQGVDIYEGIAERAQALRIIRSEIDDPDQAQPAAPSGDSSFAGISTKTLLIAGGVAVVAVLLLRK